MFHCFDPTKMTWLELYNALELPLRSRKPNLLAKLKAEPMTRLI